MPQGAAGTGELAQPLTLRRIGTLALPAAVSGMRQARGELRPVAQAG